MCASRFSHLFALYGVGCFVVLSVLVVPLLHVSAHTRTLNPTVLTNCPPAGTARAAVLPPIKLGSHATIVYSVNEATAGTLKRLDVVTGTKTEIVKLAGTRILGAQISTDGQWLLFVANVAGQSALQVVRIDGQFRQTLYCGSFSDVQWSTNQQFVLFSTLAGITLLNTTNGTLQLEVVAPTGGPSLRLRTWLDNTNAYLTLQRPDGPAESLLVLDTSKGPRQNFQNLPVVFDASTSTPFCWDFDSSFDAQHLYVSQCTTGPATHPGGGPPQGPSVLTDRNPRGFSSSFLYVNQNLAFTSIRAVTSKILLFMVGNGNGDSSQNGLWKVGTDGSHATRLTSPGEFNQFTQLPWSNVSRDGSKYVLQIVNSTRTSTTYTLEYGLLSGSAPTVFASITNVELATVGWTTM